MYMIAEVSQYVAVASFAEAWIEILLSSSRLCRCIPSPPSRRRGLKFFLPPLLRWYSLSPPSRRRGLKYSVTPEKLLTVVASFAEAWIEIPLKCLYIQPTIVASFAEAWIEIVSPSTEDKEEKSPPSRRRGLKLTMQEFPTMQIMSPPSRRRGLK